MVVVVAVVAIFVGLALHNNGAPSSAPAASSTAPSGDSSYAAPTPTPADTPAPDPETAALQQLQAFKDQDAPAIAQVAEIAHVGVGDKQSRLGTGEFGQSVPLTELRCVAGNFLFSTGANEFAGRYTAGHFDLPVMRTTIEIDGTVVVRDGVLQNVFG